MTKHQHQEGAVAIVGDGLLGLKGLSSVLSTTPNAIRTAMCRDRFPLKPLRLGNRLRWRVSDVRRYLAELGNDGAPEAEQGGGR